MRTTRFGHPTKTALPSSLHACIAWLLLMSAGGPKWVFAQDTQPANSARPTPGPAILTAPYPRAFFFRMSEGFASRTDWGYERWDGAFSRLMGIEGKVLEEELSGREARNIDFFTRFKRQHPDQLVLLHFNGNARRPDWRPERYFAGHWLYYNGSKVLSELSAEESESVVLVEDPRLFMTHIGRFKNNNEDLGICLLDENGKPDWSQSEQVQLLSIDETARALRIKRGCYGTRPRQFPAGTSYIAAHTSEGPWERQGALSWAYNHASTCPKDASGHTCGEVLADELAGLLLPGGQLETFDGVELDSLLHTCLPQRDEAPGRAEDCDADGRPDGGLVQGLNVYGIGVARFCRRLREQLGDRKLLLADGGFLINQRVSGVLNGIESEGWPESRDHQIRDWSSGLNRLWFWRENSRPPVFNYINHKFTAPGEPPGTHVPEVPYSTHRLVQAVAQFTDAGFCYSLSPPPDGGIGPGIWDELIKGREKRIGWLGRPLGPASRLALRSPDLLQGKGKTMSLGFLAEWHGREAELTVDDAELRIAARNSNSSTLRISLRDVPISGQDLFIQVTMRGDPMTGYPREIARLTWLSLTESPARRGGEPDDTVRKRSLRANGTKRNEPSRKQMTWTNTKRFKSGFYFTNLNCKAVDLTFEVEGTEPVWVSGLTAHAGPDVIYREFEHGVVLANSAPHPYTLDLEGILPDQRFRRIPGTTAQDPATNNGELVGGTLTLAGRDALFLARVQGAP